MGRDRRRGSNFTTDDLGLSGHVVTGPSMGQWDIRLLNNMLAVHGEWVIHEVALLCPQCREAGENPVIGNLNCQLCNGDGFVFSNPTQIQGIVSGIRFNKDIDDIGWAIQGDCAFSTSPTLNRCISDFDKITFTWPENIGPGQVIMRGELARRYPDKFTADEDRLNYRVSDVIACLDEDGESYRDEEDFAIEDRTLCWLNDHRPKRGKRYTIKYRAFLEWLAFNAPSGRRDNGVDLGVRVLLRQRHVVWSQDESKNPEAVNKVSAFMKDSIVI